MSQKKNQSRLGSAVALAVAASIMAPAAAMAATETTDETTKVDLKEETNDLAAAQEAVNKTNENLNTAKKNQEAAVAAENAAQTEYDHASQNLNDAQTALDAAKNEAGIAEATENVANAQNELNDAIASESDAQTAVSNQETNVANAQDNTAQAQANVDTATEAAAPYDTAALTQADTDAKNSLDQAAQQKNDDDKAATDAAANKTTTSEALDEAAANLATAQANAAEATPENIDKIKEEGEKAAAELPGLEQAQTDAETKLADAQAAYDAAKAKAGTSAGELARLENELNVANNNLATATAEKLQKQKDQELAQEVKTAADKVATSTGKAKEEAQAELDLALANNAAASSALQDAKANADQLKAAMDALEKTQTPNVVDYFASVGATDAWKILTDPTYTKYFSTIDLDQANGPAQLDNLLLALDYIDECNRIRTQQGLPLMKVGDSEMAAAIANAYYIQKIFNHPSQFNGLSENIAKGYTGPPNSSGSPFRGWFDKEETLWKNALNNTAQYPGLKDMTPYQVYVTYPSLYNATGHYLNIISPTNVVTGFAVGNNHYVQEFATASGTFRTVTSKAITPGRILTTAQYRASLLEYINGDHETAEYKAAREAYEAALKTVDTAQANATEASQKLTQAQTDRNMANAAFNQAVDAQLKAVNDLTAATNNLRDATAAQTAAQSEYNLARDNVAIAQTTATNDANAANAANQAVINADVELTAAKENVNIAQELIKKAENIEQAQEILEQAQLQFDNAKHAYDQAVITAEETAAKAAASDAIWKEAVDSYDQAHSALLEAIDADNALAAAQEALANAKAVETAAKEQLDALTTAHEAAKQKVTDAQAALAAAEAHLKQLLEDVANNVPGAQAAYDEALAQLQVAKDNLDAAILARDEADSALEDAQKAYDDALLALANAEKEAEDLEEAIDTNKPEAGNNVTGVVSKPHTDIHSNIEAAPSETNIAAAPEPVLAQTGSDGTMMLLTGAGILLTLGAGVVLTNRRKEDETFEVV